MVATKPEIREAKRKWKQFSAASDLADRYRVCVNGIIYTYRMMLDETPSGLEVIVNEVNDKGQQIAYLCKMSYDVDCTFGYNLQWICETIEELAHESHAYDY